MGTQTRFKLLAVDVDGTLVGPDQRVSDAHGLALRRARQAGLAVCLCTGRTVAETRDVWASCQLPVADPLVCVGGAVVAESDTTRTLHINPIDPVVADEAGRLMQQLGYCVVAVVDPWRWGFDYYLADGHNRVDVWQRWFARHHCTVREVDALAVQPGGPEILRLTAMVQPDQGLAVQQALQERFSQRLEVVRIYAPNYGITVVECFGAGVTKWSGVQYVAQGHRISPRDIVAVGDDVNDLPLFAKAGLSAAMGNAAPAVQAAARIVIGRHDADGLAGFVDRLLQGQWE